jgi:hypothetical protein
MTRTTSAAVGGIAGTLGLATMLPAVEACAVRVAVASSHLARGYRWENAPQLLLPQYDDRVMSKKTAAGRKGWTTPT